ncbi:TonB-dependent receptor [uncultured Bacteroides sp.]|uniref:SusC/RagA family TonB-linked outer membrane protein n=1 Tax=uncultured Bacteroides sp. TaxID=162156 RepID=UPI002AAB74FB|nr:TonB-dependent receptor [uncultured Bacteroides sp.]
MKNKCFYLKSLILMAFFCSIPLWAAAQGHLVKGVVKDVTGEPIIGASVVEVGTTNGTITDISGNFSIKVSQKGKIAVSFVGYQAQTVDVAGKTNIEIAMKENTALLNEVVVIGYGTAKKSDLTGAVMSANVKDFEKTPNTNIIQSLQGTVPGLNVGQITTAGGTPNISIRGTNTISGNTNVLIVLDGIIYNGSLSSINPADIESVDVLKDASATAVYGAQAANGVLLITSKRGKAGKAKINFASSYSVQNPTRDLHPMNREQMLNWDTEVLWHQAYTEESGYTQKKSDFNLAKWMPDPSYQLDSNGNIASNDYNWWNQFTRTGTILENKFSVSGGNDGLSYLLSLGNTTQKNMLLNDDFKRNSIRVNLDAQPRKWWKMGLQAFGSFVNQDGQETYLPFLVQMSPLALPYDESGNMISYPMRTAVENPFHGSMIDDCERHNYFFANLYSEFQLPLKGLTYRVNFGNNYTVNEHNYASKYAYSENGEAYKNYSVYNDYTLDNIFNYNNNFGKHSLSATFVYGAIRRKYSYTNADANTFARMILGYNSLEQGTNQFTYSDAWKETLLYQMFRVNYKFNDRYLVTTTVRRDGYSGFAANNKNAIFPSVALGWVVSEEPFFKIPWFNYLKLRAGYGVSGNQTSRYASLAKVNSETGYIFGDGSTGVIRQELTSMQNKDLKWEKTDGLNFGFDYAFLNNHITGSLEVYKTTTHDLLYNVAIPSITGFTTIASNVGKLNNKGIEFTVTSHNINNKDFEWNTTFNISSNSNKIASLTGQDSNGDGKEDDLVASGLFIGKSISSLYDYKVDGIYQIGDKIPEGFYPGNYRIVDTNKDGKITSDDRVVLGKTDPAYRFGIMNKLRYKNLSLSFFINSVQGGKNGFMGRNSYYVNQDDNAIRYNRFSEQADKFWSPSNPDGIYARSYTGGKITPNLYQKRDFVRLQDVTLSYDLPKSIISRIGIDGLNIYFNCKNLLTFSGWHGWDPEANNTYTDDSGTHITGSTYDNRPVMRSFTGGINISF